MPVQTNWIKMNCSCQFHDSNQAAVPDFKISNLLFIKCFFGITRDKAKAVCKGMLWCYFMTLIVKMDPLPKTRLVGEEQSIEKDVALVVVVVAADVVVAAHLFLT